jgi:ubiquinone/menaquinone biosynthesis C-methylase UbiE/thiamine kinase-like enzyme
MEETYISELICPQCHSKLSHKNVKLLCSSCNSEYKITDGIPDFRQKDGYWCNISRERMRELNKKAVESRDWLKAARELIPESVGAIEPFDRADAQFIWPINKESRILDAGAMWGGQTIPVAQNCSEIYAVDKTIETLTFLKIRAGQMGFDNIHIVASDIHELPFKNDYFDLVILNGVLEWVAVDQDIVLDVHWGKRRSDRKKYIKNPRQIQLEVLKELQRVLKPGGHLFLAIENSISYQYLRGGPDDHVNLKYVSFLPRFLANAITKWKLNSEYRTYLYTMWGYRRLLKESKYGDTLFYGAFPHYISPSEIIPANLIKNWEKAILPVSNKTWYIRAAVRLFPSSLLQFVAPSFMILAEKPSDKKPPEARIIHLLRKASLLEDVAPFDVRVMKSAGRLGSYYPANFLIYSKNSRKPNYFCKICRDNRHPDVLKNEAEKLKIANQQLEGTELSYHIPKLYYYGTINSITILVTQYIEGEPFGFNPGVKLTKKKIEKIDKSVQEAIEFLVKFQQKTKVKEVKAAFYLSSVIKNQKEILKKNGKLTAELEQSINQLTDEIKYIDNLLLPICAIHGDYNLSNNILFSESGINIVDFEHFEKEGLPFFDLATLIYNQFIIAYQRSKEKDSLFSLI